MLRLGRQRIVAIALFIGTAAVFLIAIGARWVSNVFNVVESFVAGLMVASSSAGAILWWKGGETDTTMSAGVDPRTKPRLEIDGIGWGVPATVDDDDDFSISPEQQNKKIEVVGTFFQAIVSNKGIIPARKVSVYVLPSNSKELKDIVDGETKIKNSNNLRYLDTITRNEPFLSIVLKDKPMTGS